MDYRESVKSLRVNSVSTLSVYKLSIVHYELHVVMFVRTILSGFCLISYFPLLVVGMFCMHISSFQLSFFPYSILAIC